MTHSYASRPAKSSGRRRLLLLLLLVAPLLALAIFRIGPAPELEISADRPGIGPSTRIDLSASETTRGLSSLNLTLVQGERQETLIQEDFTPRPFWAFWGNRTQQYTGHVNVGTDTIEGLEAGPITLRWTAERSGTWLRRPAPEVRHLELEVDLTPPSLQVTSDQVIIDQGGSAVVVYRIDATAVRDGVEIGDHFFPGRPLPGSTTAEHFVFFGAPHDGTDSDDIQLIAVDALGNRRAMPFVDVYRSRPMTRDTIELDEGFMTKVVTEIVSQTPEIEPPPDVLSGYLQLNGALRRTNSQQLIELCHGSESKIMWQGAFSQLPNSRVMAPFADRRTYRFEGRDVDQQDHLGFDLASVRKAPVPAANGGRVVLARYFGIYGNTVVVDHGYGLMSLYSHLSSIEVEVGQAVAQGDILGKTGKTGLAGGDHLHFSMLLWGMQVNPLEWWDRRWIEQRIAPHVGQLLRGGEG